MPDVFDVDGKKVEGVVTKEEHEKQLKEAAEQAVAEAQKTGTVVPKADLEKLQADLKAKEELLAKVDDKDKNFAELRKAKEAAEQKIKDYEDKFGKELTAIKEQLGSSEMNTAISQLADGDVEMEKKIKFHLSRIVRPEDTPEERKQKLIDAATLARGTRPGANLVAGIISSAGGVSKEDMGGFSPTGEISAELKGLGSKMGLSDKDYAKFGKK